MKVYKLTILFLVTIILFSCSEWTVAEKNEDIFRDLTESAKTEEYYENLRKYKESDHERIWLWEGKNYMNLPDSVDLVSMWEVDWRNPDPEFVSQVHYLQKTKGIKFLAPEFVPSSVTMKEFGWPKNPNDRDSANAAIKNYANYVCDIIDKYGWDGYDMDIEGSYSDPFIRVLEYRVLYMRHLSKRIGPQSGTNRLLTVNGNVWDFKGAERCISYFVFQQYSIHNSVSVNDMVYDMYNRYGYKDSLTFKETAAKSIFTTNFMTDALDVAGGGGWRDDLTNNPDVPNVAVMGMAYIKLKNKTGGDTTRYNKGGCGTFKSGRMILPGMTGTYPWHRKVIKTMNPASPASQYSKSKSEIINNKQ